jgi:hypothetical protein
MKIKNINTSYKLYKSRVKKPVDSKTYVTINNEFNKFLMEKVFKGNEIYLPERFGTIKVKGSKPEITIGEDGKVKGLAPAWLKTKKLRERNPTEDKLVYHLNEHTDGVRYRFVWNKRSSLIRNKHLYAINFTRKNKRTLAKYIFAGQEFEIR